MLIQALVRLRIRRLPIYLRLSGLEPNRPSGVTRIESRLFQLSYGVHRGFLGSQHPQNLFFWTEYSTPNYVIVRRLLGKKFALFCLSRRHKKSGKKVAQRTKATKIGGFENRFFGRKYRFLEVCVGKPTGFVHDWVRHFFTHFFGGFEALFSEGPN